MNSLSKDPPRTPLTRHLRVVAPPRLEDLPDLDNSPSSPASPLSPLGRAAWTPELGAGGSSGAGLGLGRQNSLSSNFTGSPARIQPLIPALKAHSTNSARSVSDQDSSNDCELSLTGEVVGHGAFSKVVKARSGNGAVVAIKFLRKGVPGTLEREALLMEKLRYPGHPHVVPLLAVWQGGLVMPLYEQALDRRVYALAARPRDALDFASLCEPVVDQARFFEWARQLASALQYVHARGVVHGDLKPDNILCNGDTLAICDFAASAGADDAAANNAAAFSPIYSSRAVRAGQAPGPQDDIYSLGVVLLFCATGQEPYSQAKNGAQRLMWMAKVNPEDSYGAEETQRTRGLGLGALLGSSPPSAAQAAATFAQRAAPTVRTPPMSPPPES